MSTFIHIKFEQVGSQQELIWIHSIPCRAYMNVNLHVCMLCGHVTCFDCILILHYFLEDRRETKILKAINFISPVCQKHEAFYTNRNTETIFKQLFYIIIKTDYTTGQNQNLQFPHLLFIWTLKPYKVSIK